MKLKTWHPAQCLFLLCALSLAFAPALSATGPTDFPIPITAQIEAVAQWLSGPIIKSLATIMFVVTAASTASAAREDGSKVFGTKAFWLCVGSGAASIVGWLNIGGAVVG